MDLQVRLTISDYYRPFATKFIFFKFRPLSMRLKVTNTDTIVSLYKCQKKEDPFSLKTELKDALQQAFNTYVHFELDLIGLRLEEDERDLAATWILVTNLSK